MAHRNNPIYKEFLPHIETLYYHFKPQGIGLPLPMIRIDNIDVHDTSEMSVDELQEKDGLLFPVDDISGKLNAYSLMNGSKSSLMTWMT